MAYAPIEYRGYKIYRGNYTPYEFMHEEYDPTPVHAYDGPSDHRCGTGASIEDCMDQIDDQREGFCSECEDPLDHDIECRSCAAVAWQERQDQIDDAADHALNMRREEM